MSRSLALSLVALVLIAAGCGNDRKSVSNVTAIQGDGLCTIWVGEERGNVLLRCGPPCAEGLVPDGKCPRGEGGTCTNRCEIYFDVEVCYAGPRDRSVSVRRLDREFDRFEWCFWPQPQQPPRRPSPDAGRR